MNIEEILHGQSAHLERAYDTEHEGVRYLDGSSLKRPSRPTGPALAFIGIVVAAGIVLGGLFVNTTVIEPLRASEDASSAVAQNLAKEPSIASLPKLAEMATLSNDEIKKVFDDAGYTYIAQSEENDSDLTLYKLPADTSSAAASLMYLKGFSALNAGEASKLMNGGWLFSADRTANSMVVRYADFASGSVEAAMRSAITAQGFEADSVTDTGTDEAGNTFAEGEISVEGTDYVWKVSGIQLSSVYDIAGLPETSCYIGIRLTKAA